MTQASTSADLILQKAVYDALKDTVFGDVRNTIPVYDTVPENTPMPYIVIGETTGVPDNTKDQVGEILNVTIHIWSDKPGYKEVKNIRNMVETLLTSENPELQSNGKDCRKVQAVYKDAFTDIDMRKKHGILRLEYWVNDLQ